MGNIGIIVSFNRIKFGFIKWKFPWYYFEEVLTRPEQRTAMSR